MGNTNTKNILPYYDSPVKIYCHGWNIDKNQFHKWLNLQNINLKYLCNCYDQCWCVNNNELINNLLPNQYIVVEDKYHKYFLIHHRYSLTRIESVFELNSAKARIMACLFNSPMHKINHFIINLKNIQYLNALKLYNIKNLT
jgi:hypothetical protein